MTKVAYDVNGVNAVLQYLETKPYKEVKSLIEFLQLNGQEVNIMPPEPNKPDTEIKKEENT